MGVGFPLKRGICFAKFRSVSVNFAKFREISVKFRSVSGRSVSRNFVKFREISDYIGKIQKFYIPKFSNFAKFKVKIVNFFRISRNFSHFRKLSFREISVSFVSRNFGKIQNFNFPKFVFKLSVTFQVNYQWQSGNLHIWKVIVKKNSKLHSKFFWVSGYLIHRSQVKWRSKYGVLPIQASLFQ